MYYVYVDPVSGSDTPTGARKSTTAATAAASPWKTLAVALAQEAANLTTLGDDITFRLLAGQENISTAFGPTETQYPGADNSSSRQLIFEGYGTGVHDGTMATTNGYTIGRSSGFGNLWQPENVNCTYRDFRFRNNYGGDAVTWSGSGYSRQIMDRMLVFSIDGRALRTAGGNSTDRLHDVLNSVLVARDYRTVQVDGSDLGTRIRHCTILANHATEPALYLNAATAELRYNYVGNLLAGGAMVGTYLATSTVDQNATSDTSGTSGMQSIAAATGSGARFTSLTAASENLDISSSSSLRDIATNSSVTVDAKGRSRATPDAGAFEYPTATVTVTDASDEVFYNGETSIPITGTAFGASQGSGKVYLSPTNNVADGSRVEQTVTSWSDTSIQITAVKGGLSFDTTLYLFVVNNGGSSNSPGYQVQIQARPWVRDTLVNETGATVNSETGMTMVVYHSVPTAASPNPAQVIESVTTSGAGALNQLINRGALALDAPVWIALMKDGSPAKGTLRKVTPVYE